LPIGGDHDDGQEPRRRELLAVRQLRRDLERLPHPCRASRRPTVAVKRPRLARDLRELIAALDRRAPRVERAGERAIARDAATLRREIARKYARPGSSTGAAGGRRI